MKRRTPVYDLVNGEQQHRKASGTFEIPPLRERKNVAPGTFAKCMFRTSDPRITVERMWVLVSEMKDGRYVGKLDNDPAIIPTKDLVCGDIIEFGPEHIINILDPKQIAHE